MPDIKAKTRNNSANSNNNRLLNRFNMGLSPKTVKKVLTKEQITNNPETDHITGFSTISAENPEIHNNAGKPVLHV